MVNLLDSAATRCHSDPAVAGEESRPAQGRGPIPSSEAAGRRKIQSEIPRCARNDSRLPHSIGLVRRIFARPIIAALLLFAATLANDLYGQTWNSHLEGIVLDPSGAAVPATSLELRNPANGQARQTQTDANGFYSFPFLPVGNYELEIAKPGFVSKVLRGLALRVGETTRVDIRLEIAHERTEIQVDSRPPLVEAA